MAGTMVFAMEICSIGQGGSDLTQFPDALQGFMHLRRFEQNRFASLIFQGRDRVVCKFPGLLVCFEELSLLAASCSSYLCLIAIAIPEARLNLE
jgi:hypothetical protein